MSLPKLPSETFSLIGPVPVVRQDLNPEHLFGDFRGVERRIRVHSDLPPAAAWQTFWHETGHLFLHDAGISPELPRKLEERIVDALGVYMTAAMRAGYLKVTP